MHPIDEEFYDELMYKELEQIDAQEQIQRYISLAKRDRREEKRQRERDTKGRTLRRVLQRRNKYVNHEEIYAAEASNH